MNSIRQRILIFMLIAGFVPLIIVTITTHTVIQRELMNSEEAKVEDIVLHLARHVAEIMDRAAHDLETLKTQPILTDPDADLEVQLSEMRRLVNAYEVYSDISLYDAAGHLICSTTEDHPVFKEYSAWFRRSLTGETVISQPERKLNESGLFLMVYLPVLSPDHSVHHVIKARLSFDRVLSLLTGVRVGQEGSVFLLDEWGNLICGPDSSGLLTKFDEKFSIDSWTFRPVGTYAKPSGENFLYAARVLPESSTQVGSQWVLLALKPMSEVNAVLSHAQITLAGAATIMVLVAVILGYFLSRHISRPFENASRAAQEVAAGNLDVHMDTSGPREILEMAESFNQMGTQIKEHREGLENLVDTRTHSLNQSQKEHEKTSAHLQAALEGSNNGFLVEDLDGRIVTVNQLFLDLFEMNRAQVSGRGINEVIEEMLDRAISDGDTQEVRKAIQDPEATVDKEIVFETPKRRHLDVHSAPIRKDTGEIIGRVWTLRDNTENRQLEESLRQSQKMEAIGQLAGGVAHDFNNLLTGILGNLSLIELNSNTERDTRNGNLLSRAIGASDRAAELVKNLLGFSRRSHMDLKPCDTDNVLREVRGLLVATIDPSIRIEVDLPEQTWGVMADPNLLSQVIMNMAVNAKDALEGRKDGLIQLQSRNQKLSKKAGKLRSGLPAGDYVCLSVEDNGDGIPEEIQKRIFEPFFTTKEQGKGTGLGLATSFGIIKQLGGSIHLESDSDIGTRFDIYLPRSVVAEAQPREETNPAMVLDLEEVHDGTLLLVDDEDLVRSVGVSLLEKLGYRTLVAASGEEALEIYQEHGDEIDLIILDMTMPGLSGTDTLRELRERHEYVPVLICSGYLVDLTEIEAECGSCPDGFVQKPYQVETMTETINRILDSVHGKAA